MTTESEEKNSLAMSNKPVADNIQHIIKERALSRPEVARRAGMNPRWLYDVIKGNRLIRANEIKAIAMVLNLPIDALFRD